ncbi:DeoR/GlpR family transcriptional regulator of sugar metabolism [Devosia sp. UYZn731]
MRHPGVLIATPNLEVAYSYALKTDATVYVYGGYVRNKDSPVLTLADSNRQRFKFDIAIIGARVPSTAMARCWNSIRWKSIWSAISCPHNR